MWNSYILSTLRTLVPYGVSLVIGVAGFLGLPVNSEIAAAVATAGIAAGWYLLWRGLELAAVRLGWTWLRRTAGVLLGWPRQPEYQREDGKGPDFAEMGRALRTSSGPDGPGA